MIQSLSLVQNISSKVLDNDIDPIYSTHTLFYMLLAKNNINLSSSIRSLIFPSARKEVPDRYTSNAKTPSLNRRYQKEPSQPI